MPVTSFAQALEAASEFSGKRIDQFDPIGNQSSEAWLVAPADDEPEDSPCYLVFRSGEIVAKGWADHIELDEFAEKYPEVTA